MKPTRIEKRTDLDLLRKDLVAAMRRVSAELGVNTWPTRKSVTVVHRLKRRIAVLTMAQDDIERFRTRDRNGCLSTCQACKAGDITVQPIVLR